MYQYKRIAALCTALTLSISILAMPVSAEETKTGSFGASYAWELTEDQFIFTHSDPSFTMIFQDGTCRIDGEDISDDFPKEWDACTQEQLAALKEAQAETESAPIREVYFSDNVKSIDRHFQFGKDLETVWLGDNVEIIGTSSFEESSMQSIRLPDSLKTIGENAFLRCEKLENVTIPAQTETIGTWAFCTCSNLKDVTILSRTVSLEETGLGYTGFDGFELDVPLEPIENMTIRGYAGSTAESYAAENGFRFITLEESDGILYGDVNLDGIVDISDAVLLSKAVSGSVQLGTKALEHADCSGDETLSMSDVTALLRFLVHLEEILPISGDPQ